MKQTLLIFLFLLSSLLVYSQTSFSSRLSPKKTGETEKIDIKIFPNPATDYIELTNSKLVAKVMVFSIVGRQVAAFETAEGDKFFVGDLPRGMYLVQMLGSKGDILSTQRLNKH
jgi:hypothetical protein